MKKIAEHEFRALLALRRRNWSLRRIAKTIGCTHTAVAYRLRRDAEDEEGETAPRTRYFTDGPARQRIVRRACRIRTKGVAINRSKSADELAAWAESVILHTPIAIIERVLKDPTIDAFERKTLLEEIRCRMGVRR